ncbi:MAG: PD40 domain-containing protein, partial [Bacteroidales bacterium]|nr:PD40 domain-containing protein [Bacteroidales bacterium]
MLYSAKNNGVWSSPVNLNELLKVDRDIYPTSISKDGRTLYIYNAQDYDGNIFSTVFENGAWSPILKLNDNINTKYWESHAAISHDNKKLYFTSNRKGTYGGLDIFVSVRDTSGDWGPAVNLGPVINTPYNEDTPFLSEDDRTLFFSSRGHLNMGGYDIFYTTLQENGEWSVPRNLGYPLNTTDDDLFFKPVKNGHAGYMAKYNPDNYGKQDLYRIEIYSEEHPRIFQVMGLARGADIQNSVRISAVNKQMPEQELVVNTNPENGLFEFEARHGEWDLTYESEGSEKLSTSINIPMRNPSDTFMLAEVTLARDYADFFMDPDSLYAEAKDDSLHHENTDVPDISDTSDRPVVKQPTEIPQYNRVITEIQSLPAPEIEKPVSDEIEKTTSGEIVQESGITTAVQTDETDFEEARIPEGEKKNLKFLWWLLFAAGLIFMLIIVFRRRKKKDKNIQPRG